MINNKNIVKIFVAASIAFGFSPVMAANPFEIGATVGIQVSDWETDGAGVTLDGQSGLVIGATFFKDWGSAFQLRAGGYYSERKAELKATGIEDTEFSVQSVDVPITALFSIAEGFGVFVGPMFSLAVADSCDGEQTICDNFDPESFRTSATFGVSARVHPNWSVEAFYNLGLSEIAEDTDANSAGVQAVFIY